MKKFRLAWIIPALLVLACSKPVHETLLPEVPLSELPKYNLGILPDHPTSADDIRLVVYNDCKYNRLVSVQRTGTVVEIVKQFNSMIMAPCVLTNDTILVGKLPPGTWRFDYRLVDIAVPPGKTTLGISFKLTVGK